MTQLPVAQHANTQGKPFYPENTYMFVCGVRVVLNYETKSKRIITQRNILKCETKRNETKYTKMRNATKYTKMQIETKIY